jgi:hypothetical protein
MKNYLYGKILSIFLTAAWIIATLSHAFAQTSPPAQSLPFSFTEISGGALPDGVAVHRFGTTSAAIPTTRTTSPANGDLPYLCIACHLSIRFMIYTFIFYEQIRQQMDTFIGFCIAPLFYRYDGKLMMKASCLQLAGMYFCQPIGRL